MLKVGIPNKNKQTSESSDLLTLKVPLKKHNPTYFTTVCFVFFEQIEPNHLFFKLKLIQPSQPVWIPPTDPVVFRCVLEVHVVKSYGTCLDLDRRWWCQCGTLPLGLGWVHLRPYRRDIF